MLQIPHIWIPRADCIPPSPPAEQRAKVERELVRQNISYRGNMPVVPGYEEPGRPTRLILPGQRGYMETLRQVCMPLGVGAYRSLKPFGGVPTINGVLLGEWRADKNVYNDAGTTLATDGQTVQQWNTQPGGTAGNFSQATSGSRPTFKTTGGPNNLQRITQPTGNTMLMTSSTTVNMTTSGYALFIALKQEAWTLGKIVWRDSGGSQFDLRKQTTTPGIRAEFTGGVNWTQNDGATLNTWVIYTLSAPKSGNGYTQVNQAASVNGSTTAGSTSSIDLMWHTDVMNMAHVLLYSLNGSGNLSSSDQQAVTNYINGQWGNVFF